jgi:hypothetical protein
MGRSWVVVLFFVFSLTYSQDPKEGWEVKSDSAYLLIKNGKADEAMPIINSIDNVLAERGIDKGIPYVNFLYRRAITYYFLKSPKSLDALKETLIALKKDYDHEVAVKTNYFLGDLYFYRNEDELAEKYLAENIRLEGNIEVNKNLESALLKMLYIESESKPSKSEKYRNLYIELKKEQGDTINLNYSKAFKLYGYDEKYLDISNQIILKNQKSNTIDNNIEVYKDLMFHFSNKKDYQSSVIFGNKLYNTAKKTSNITDKVLRQYCDIMGYSYYQLGDDVNQKKLSSICYKLKNDKDVSKYFGILEDLLHNGELEEFEKYFHKFENILKSNIDKPDHANQLLSIYSISLSLYETGNIFSLDEIKKQFNYIDKHESHLDKEYLELKMLLKAEFYFFSNQFEKLQKICNTFNRTDNTELNLSVYFLQTMADEKNKTKKPKGLSLFLREIDECNCIDEPKYLRYYNALVSGVLNETETYKWASKALSLIDKYNLNYTEQGMNLRIEIAKQYAANNNISDALKIYDDIYKHIGKKNNLSNLEIAYIQTLYGLGEIYLVSNKLEKAKIYLVELENLKGVTSQGIENLRESYKHSLKLRYLFRSKEYLKHKEVFESLNLKDKYFENILIGLETDNYVLSKYFLDKNIDETIKSFKNLLTQKPSLRRAQLLFKFQLTKNPDQPNTKILIDALQEEFKSFNSKANFLNRSEFVQKISEMQSIVNDISNFLTYLSNEDLSILIELKNNISIWQTNLSKRQLENEEFLKLDSKINNYRRRIEQELEKATQNDILIDSLRFEVNKSERMLNSNLGKNNNLEFKPIGHYLSSEDIFIEYIQTNGFYNEVTDKYICEPELLAIVLSKNELPKVVNLGNIDENIIDKLKDTYSTNIQLKNVYEQDEYVWNYMLKPLYETLSSFDNIYVKKNGALGFINLEAIHIPDSDDLMVDRFNINQVDAVFKIKHDSSDFNVLENIGIFGNPDFESHNNQNNISRDTIKNNRNTSFDIKLSYLIGAKEEIELIEKKASDFGIKSKLYDFIDASESNFKTDNDYDVIHIATHAYDLNSLNLEQSSNSLNIFGLDKLQVKNNYYGFKNKGLFFTGSQNTIDENEFTGFKDNGILNGNEITNMELNGVKLVVLSACNTIDSSGKGYTNSGLDKAFLDAGVKEVLATLWDIDDIKTREFMGLFYENYFSIKSNALEALNKTKKQFRIMNPEPYYWAPFVIVR